jgi:tRNA-splicing endonuclease subunit Sen34
MPEEARLLVDKGVACIVDEAKAHNGMQSLLEEDRRQYLRELESQGLHVTRILAERKDQQRDQKLKEQIDKKAKVAKAKAAKAADGDKIDSPATAKDDPASVADLFDDSASRKASVTAPQQVYGMTPITSYPPLPHPSTSSKNILPRPDVPLIPALRPSTITWLFPLAWPAFWMPIWHILVTLFGFIHISSLFLPNGIRTLT